VRSPRRTKAPRQFDEAVDLEQDTAPFGLVEMTSHESLHRRLDVIGDDRRDNMNSAVDELPALQELTAVFELMEQEPVGSFDGDRLDGRSPVGHRLSLADKAPRAGLLELDEGLERDNVAWTLRVERVDQGRESGGQPRLARPDDQGETWLLGDSREPLRRIGLPV